MRFWVDFAAWFPFDWIVLWSFNAAQSDNFHRWLGMLTLLRLVSLRRFANVQHTSSFDTDRVKCSCRINFLPYHIVLVSTDGCHLAYTVPSVFALVFKRIVFALGIVLTQRYLCSQHAAFCSQLCCPYTKNVLALSGVTNRSYCTLQQPDHMVCCSLDSHCASYLSHPASCNDLSQI